MLLWVVTRNQQLEHIQQRHVCTVSANPVGLFLLYAQRPRQGAFRLNKDLSMLSESGELVQTRATWLTSDAGSVRVTSCKDAFDVCREFAALQKPDDVFSFAAAHGWLGIAENVVTGTTLAVGERIARWLHEAKAMAELLDWWELAQSKNIGALGKRIHVDFGKHDDGRRLRFDYQRLRGWLWHVESMDPAFFQKLKKDDYVRMAEAFLILFVNKKLAKSALVTPAALLVGSQVTIKLRPRNLLGSMWCYALQMISKERVLRKCAAPDCGTYMDITECARPGSKRFHSACAHR